MKNFEYEIGPVKHDALTDADVGDLNSLAAELSPRYEGEITPDIVKQLQAAGNVMLGARVPELDGRIVGMASLIISHQLLYNRAWLEDVAVLPDFRGRGIGKKLVVAVMVTAHELDLSVLNLISSPPPDAAYELYEGLGWEAQNATQMRLAPGEVDPEALNTSGITLPTTAANQNGTLRLVY